MEDSVRFNFEAYGHPHILSTHEGTIELTRDDQLSLKGNCIVGVKATHGLVDLPSSLRRVLMTDSGRGRLELKVGEESFVVEGEGAKGLNLVAAREMVIRKSGFLSDRTLMVHANKASIDLPRTLIEKLKNPRQKILAELSAWHV